MARLIPLDVLQERFAEHSTLAKGYVERVNALHSLKLQLDEASLYVAVKSAYDDVERYKIYHQDNPEAQKSNAVKRVSYLTKWLMKMRPIQSIEHGINDIKPLLANAGFSIAVARSHIAAELKREFFLSLQKEYEMSYDLTFREINGDALLAIYQNIYDLVDGRSPIEDLA